MPPSVADKPFNQPPAPTPKTSNTTSERPKPRSNRNAKPKLSTAHFTNPQTIASALSIGRRYAGRVDSQSHDPAALLSSFLDRMTKWSSQVEPDLELPEFVVAAQALGGNRELKQFMANIRLAELRQVTDAWRTVQEEKREKKRRKRVVKIEEDDSDDEGQADREDIEPPSTPPNGDYQEESGAAGDTNDYTSDKDYRASMMKDPEVLARIERNRLLALEKRRAAQGKKSVQEPPTMPVDQKPLQFEKPDSIDIDPNDVIDPHEDVDLAVLDEMELAPDQIAQTHLPPRSHERDDVGETNSLEMKQHGEQCDNGGAVNGANTVMHDNAKEAQREKNGLHPPTANPSSQEKEDANVPMMDVDNSSATDEVAKTCNDATKATIDDLKQIDAVGRNIRTARTQEKLQINPTGANSDSQNAPVKDDKAVSGEKRYLSHDGQLSSDNASMMANEADKGSLAVTTMASPSTAPGKETQEDIDMDILAEFEAGAAEDY
eukprot:GFKZ01011821.1.p1 GENE.GFKZ01011821.1~~GFKZ01011821.1.p1  ORF type:complete len:491 (+),score=107.93 GFKZ01011821.1:149-1621(+)